MDLRHALALLSLAACSDSNAASSNDGGAADVAREAGFLDPSNAHAIPRFITPMPRLPVLAPTSGTDYTIDVREITQQVLPDEFPPTKVWGYGGTWPGGTIEATRGVPVRVTLTNDLVGVTPMFTVDATLLAPSEPPLTLAMHLHGGESSPADDGHPLAFVAPGSSATYVYGNAQPPATLWYHDDAFGLARLNVMAGLAGFYLLRDPADPIAARFPSGDFEIPIVIQDRSFAKDGSLAFPSDGTNPSVHPSWRPDFFGDVIVVNGRAWPKLDVQPAAYRFRLLNASNARFYDLRLVDEGMNAVPLVQIGGDGGYLAQPASIDSILLAPGERADVVVDLSTLAGHRLRFVNDANAPYPSGAAPDPETTGQILAVTVASASPIAPAPLPSTLASIPALAPNAPPRVVTLYDLAGNDGPLASTLNAATFDAPASETPRVGSTEDWEIVNLTPDARPIHLHLVQFQIVRRQPLDAAKYTPAWLALGGASLDPSAYFDGPPRAPTPSELGWKDTVAAMPSEVTIVRVRFAPTDVDAVGLKPGANRFAFDPTASPGYVWQGAILDRSDNVMIRPLAIAK